MIKIGFITSNSDKLLCYFPTAIEPDFVPVEPPFTPDDQIAVDYLRQICEVDVSPVVWRTSVENLSAYDLLVVRSPWDYMDSKETRQEFLQWIGNLDKAGIAVCNKPELINWLIDKHYLENFEQAGIPIVPTDYTLQREFIDTVKIYQQKGPFIIKPCVSAAGVGLRYIHNAEESELYQESINKDAINETFMIQDFVKEIQTNGEWSLIYFGGEYSHAVHKKPASTSIFVHAERGGSLNFDKPCDKLIDFGNKVINVLNIAFEFGTNKSSQDNALYIRIDVIETQSGYLLSECEGVEPELFFRARAGSEEIFARHLIKFVSN